MGNPHLFDAQSLVSPIGEAAAAASHEVSPVQFLILDRERRANDARAQLLCKRVGADRVWLCNDASDAIRTVDANRAARVIAFVGWPLDGVDARGLVQRLAARGAYIVALVPPDAVEHALATQREGANDILLTPCAPEALVVRALLAAEAATRNRPAPWYRPRAVLQQALEHASGGEVIVRGGAGTMRIIVARGHIAWIHDDTDLCSLVDHLRDAGVHVSAEDLAAVIAECQRTGEHFAELLAQWGLASLQIVSDAVRSILDTRLHSALANEDAAALFVPSRWQEEAQLCGCKSQSASKDNCV
jgi:hypothetical protein